ncbi:MAG: hypothetical protein HRT54_03625 [Colwellia sp.]|nr:hypothetical protein [Colwellia sp.]
MNKYFKAFSISLVLISSNYLPTVNAASSTEMLITVAETNPVLLERLNSIALNNPELLNQLLKMANSKPDQLERLLNIAETDPEAFTQLIIISDAEKAQEEQVTMFGIDDEGGIIRP